MTPENLAILIKALITAVVGFPLSYFLSSIVAKNLGKKITAQVNMLVRKGIFYSGCIFVTVSILKQFGFELSALLGAAGIVGIAIGFASQTSVSNIISGIFLISEKPFLVGDVIKVGDTTGAVLSIDLLSVKLRTFDNQFVRLPNETLIKNQVNNITHFPIRRLDINIGVAYKEDVARVEMILKDIASKNTCCLDEPEPLVIFSNFGNSALELLFAVWCERSEFLKLKKSMMLEIKRRFDEEGIEIPFPHITLYSGSVTEPFPIKLSKASAAQPEPKDEPQPQPPIAPESEPQTEPKDELQPLIKQTDNRKTKG